MSKKQQKQVKNNKNESFSQSINSETTDSKAFLLPTIPAKFQWLILVGAITIICFFIFNKYLTFKNAYLFKDIGSDSLNIFYPYYVTISEFLKNGSLPTWSFKVGMGQNIFPYYGDFHYILLSFFSKEQIPFALVYLEVLKIFLGGLLFYGYLKTLFNNNYIAILGGLMFAFCGYMILGGSGWYVHSTEAVITAFVMFSFEKLLKENRWYWFPLAIGVLASFQPYYVYTHTVFLLFYSIFRLSYENDGWNWKNALSFYVKLIGLGALGIGMGAIGCSALVWHLVQSPRVSGGTGYFDTLSSKPILALGDGIQYVSLIMRSFSSDLLGTGTDYKGWQNYLESPITYIGVINFLLFPQIFAITKGWRRKIFIVLGIVWILPLIFPFFRYMYWGFSGDYFRNFGFFIGIIFLFVGLNSLKILIETRKINFIVLGVSLFLSLILLYGNLSDANNVIQKSTRTFITFLLIFYTSILVMLRSENFQKIAKVLLFIGICGELLYLSKITTYKRDSISKTELNDKAGYNDYSIDAIEYIKSVDKTPFFRTDKNYMSGNAMHASLNDAMVQGYYGTESYSSFNQGNYIAFLRGLGIISEKNPYITLENQTRWSNGFRYADLMQAFVSVKYYLRNDSIQHNKLLGFQKIKQFGNVSIFENKNFLPLGFTYNQYITKENFQKLSMDNRAKLLYKACIIGEDEIKKYPSLKPFNLADSATVFTVDDYVSSINQLKKNAYQISSFRDSEIKGNINLDEDKMVFFSIPHDRGWNCIVDGKDTEISVVDFGLSGLYLPKGKHNIEFYYERPFFKEGILASGISCLIFIGLIGLSFWQNRKKN